MAGVCAPVTVVTTADDAGPPGTTVSAFASLSLQPPLVSVAFDRDSACSPQIAGHGRFGVNILAHDQDEVAVLFARRGVDRFGSVPGTTTACPGWPSAAGWAVCELYRTSKPVTIACCSAWSRG